MPPNTEISRPGYNTLLADSPMLNKERAKKLFPSPEEKAELRDLAQAIDIAIAENKSAAQTWQSLGNLKSTVLKLASEAIGRSIPGL